MYLRITFENEKIKGRRKKLMKKKVWKQIQKLNSGNSKSNPII